MQTLEQNKDIVLKCLRKERDKLEMELFDNALSCRMENTRERMNPKMEQELESINWGIRIIIATH